MTIPTRKNKPGAGPPKGSTNASKGLKGEPRITITVLAQDLASWKAAAGEASLSDWARDRLNLAAKKKKRELI